MIKYFNGRVWLVSASQCVNACCESLATVIERFDTFLRLVGAVAHHQVDIITQTL